MEPRRRESGCLVPESHIRHALLPGLGAKDYHLTQQHGDAPITSEPLAKTCPFRKQQDDASPPSGNGGHFTLSQQEKVVRLGRTSTPEAQGRFSRPVQQTAAAISRSSFIYCQHRRTDPPISGSLDHRIRSDKGTCDGMYDQMHEQEYPSEDLRVKRQREVVGANVSRREYLHPPAADLISDTGLCPQHEAQGDIWRDGPAMAVCQHPCDRQSE